MDPTLPIPRGKRACVIGAGLGGLALAIRLEAAGVETVVVEARRAPGGCAGVEERDGFTFDTGPEVISDPGAIGDLWALTGQTLADDLELLPVQPIFRLNWPDGTTFDLSADQGALAREIARIAPSDLAGFDEFQHFAQSLQREAPLREAAWGKPLLRAPADFARTLPGLARHQAWRGLHAVASGFVRNERLREAISFRALMVGGNPASASALHAAGHELEQANGAWAPRGGMNRLVAALAHQFERLGGVLRLHDPVRRIHTVGTRVSEIETQSGWRERFDAAASNADLVHTYRELLGENPRGSEMARRLARKRWSPGLFVVHFGIEGSWPGIPHQTMLLGPRYTEFFADVFDHGVLPADMVLYLGHPSVTDPSLAPAGKSVFTAVLPVANRAKLPIDWEAIGPMLEKRVLDEVGRRLIPDIHDRIVTRFHTTPRDSALDLGVYQGSAFSLEPTLMQSGWLRPRHRDDKVRNLYLVGAGTQPGAGVAGVIAGARTTAAMMLEELK